MNPANVSYWFEMLEGFITEYDIQPELIYGMDESGFPTGDPRKEHIIGQRGTKMQHKQIEGDCQNTTILVTICANSTALCSTIIWKGKNFLKKWNANNPLGAL